MAIKAAPVTSPKLYLGDLLPAVKELEGEDCQEKDRAWVVVRQATEGDNRRISDLSAETRFVYREETAEQVTNVNQAEVRAMQIYLTLVDAGNIVGDDDKPLFKFNNSRLAMSQSEFQKAYETLHPDATWAMLLAVREINPLWDPSTEQWVKCEHCGLEFALKDKHFVPLAKTKRQGESES